MLWRIALRWHSYPRTIQTMNGKTKNEFTPYFCRDNNVDVILPPDKIKEDETKEWLVIGWPGVDGIQFRVKSIDNDQSIFAFYPMEQEYIKVADSDNDLIEKWKSGKLKL
jgi:hypothetical protein